MMAESNPDGVTINLFNLWRQRCRSYYIAFSQPEAHTKRFNLAGDEKLSHPGYWRQ